MFHQLLDRYFCATLPPVTHHQHCVADFGQVVRRDAGRKANGYPGGSVHQDVGVGGRQHGGLLERSIKVVHPIDRVRVEVPKEFEAQRSQTSLGVPECGRPVAVNAAKVALSIHQRVQQGKVLRHSSHGVIDRCVAVWMILANDFANHPGAFLVRPSRRQTHLVHGKDNSTLYRL